MKSLLPVVLFLFVFLSVISCEVQNGTKGKGEFVVDEPDNQREPILPDKSYPTYLEKHDSIRMDAALKKGIEISKPFRGIDSISWRSITLSDSSSYDINVKVGIGRFFSTGQNHLIIKRLS